MREISGYALLQSSEPRQERTSGGEWREHGEHLVRQGREDNTKHYLRWACIAVISSAILSFALLAGEVIISQVTIRAERNVLRRPNPYVNLDRVLKATNLTYPPVVNFPRVTMQIQTSDPHRRMTEQDRGHWTSFGSVYPDDRRITVNAKTSTITHFRNMDYAMERCSLNISVPERSEKFDPNATIFSPSIVDIWLLDTTTEFSRYIDGSMEHAPARRNLLATIQFTSGASNHTGEFFCPSLQYTTIELACSSHSPQCEVDFWQDKRATPTGGVFLTQYYQPSGHQANDHSA